MWELQCKLRFPSESLCQRSTRSDIWEFYFPNNMNMSSEIETECAAFGSKHEPMLNDATYFGNLVARQLPHVFPSG